MGNSPRFRALGVLFFLVFAIIVVKLATLQILEADEYREAQSEFQSAAISFQRGDILLHSKEGEFVAATEKPFYTVAIDSRKVVDKDALFARIQKYFPITRDVLNEKTKNANDPFEIISRRVDDEIVDSLKVNVPPGLIFITEDDRYYPAGELAAHVIGFVGGGSEGKKGKYGIEQSKDAILTGKISNEANFLGQLAEVLKTGTSEQDVLLSLDVGIQSMAERILDETLQKWNSSHGGIVVIDPGTGAIYAMAGRPAFDPNNYSKEKDFSVFINPITEHNYEMGSILKPLTMAAAIDSGKVSPEETYFDAGYRVIDGRKISNYDGKGRGQVKMQEILSQSLNTGAIHLAEKMGFSTFEEYLHKFGFGEMTGIEVPENKSNISNLSSRRGVEYATASFGQGISLTPLSLAVALASIANGGELVTPYLISEIRKPDGTVVDTRPMVKRRVLKESSAKEVTRMLVKVVDEALIGGKGGISGYSMAAKTGTAFLIKDGGGYSEELRHSFFGYAPAYDPKFLILMYIDRPRGVEYASQTLTQPFRELMAFSLRYYDVLPDRL